MKIVKTVKEHPFETVIFSLVFLFGLIWTFLIPPFQKADESTHYFRAASVSRGELTCSMGDVEDALEIRERHFQFAEAVDTRRVASNYAEKVDVKSMLKAVSNVDDDNPNIVDWDGCGLGFVSYLVFAVPILIGGLFDSLLLGFYLSRLVAFLLFFVAVVWSFERISNSKLKWVIVFYALTPMVLHQASAIGYDYLTLTLIPIIFALSIDFMQREEVSRKQVIIYCILLILLSLAKPGYYFLSLLYFLIPAKKAFKGKYKYLLFTLTFFATYIIADVLMQNLFLSSLSELNNTDLMIEKIKEPGVLFDLITNTINLRLDFYVESFIGRFGWLDYTLSPLFKYLYIGLFSCLAYCISTEKIFKNYLKMITLLSMMFLLSFGVIFGGFYLVNFRGDNSQVVGVQGRYFLVFLPFIFLLVGSIIRGFRESKIFRIITVGIIFLYTLYQMLFSIYSRYYEKVEANSYSIDSINTILARRDTKVMESTHLYKIPICEPK